MPLSEAEKQELQELRRLDELEAKFANHPQAQQQAAPTPTPEEPGFIEKGLNMIPGMQERWDKGAKLRATPEYQQNHPKPSDGSEDPAYSALGMVSEAPIWALAKSVPSAARRLRDFLKPGAQRSEAISQIKAGTSNAATEDLIKQAQQSFSMKQKSPLFLEEQSRLQGNSEIPNTVKLDLERLKGISPEIDAYISKVSVSKPDLHGIYGRQGSAVVTGGEGAPAIPGQRTVVTHGYENPSPQTTDVAGYSTIAEPTSSAVPKQPTPRPFSTVESAGTPGTAPGGMSQVPNTLGETPKYSSIEVPATEAASELRPMLNEAIKWKLNPKTGESIAPHPQAAALHQDLSRQLEGIDPAVGKLMQDAKGKYDLEKDVFSGDAFGNNKVITSDNATGIAKKEALQQYGKDSGVDLSARGRALKTANDRLRPVSVGDVFSIHGPKHVAVKAVSPATRAYDAIAEKAYPGLDKIVRNPENVNSYGMDDLIRYIGRPKRDQ